jgi:hypothetical protein
MTSGHFKPHADNQPSPALRLMIDGQAAKTPILIPVVIRNLSTGGVILTVPNPWEIADWDLYRGVHCALRVEDHGGGEAININAKIVWTSIGGAGQPPLSLGLQLIKPPGEGIRRLSNLLPHTSQDIKGLWERYDQVRESPNHLDSLVQHFYIAGLVFLVGGLALQFAGSPVYKGFGWGLWVFGSLGIAVKIIRPFRLKQPSGDRIGRSL